MAVREMLDAVDAPTAPERAVTTTSSSLNEDSTITTHTGDIPALTLTSAS